MSYNEFILRAFSERWLRLQQSLADILEDAHGKKAQEYLKLAEDATDQQSKTYFLEAAKTAQRAARSLIHESEMNQYNYDQIVIRKVEFQGYLDKCLKEHPQN